MLCRDVAPPSPAYSCPTRRTRRTLFSHTLIYIALPEFEQESRRRPRDCQTLRNRWLRCSRPRLRPRCSRLLLNTEALKARGRAAGFRSRPPTRPPARMPTHKVRLLQLAPLQDAVAVHARKDHDVFAHHVRDAPVLEAVAELTDVDADFREGPPPPDPKHIHTTLETKVSRGVGIVRCMCDTGGLDYSRFRCKVQPSVSSLLLLLLVLLPLYRRRRTTWQRTACGCRRRRRCGARSWRRGSPAQWAAEKLSSRWGPAALRRRQGCRSSSRHHHKPCRCEFECGSFHPCTGVI